MPYKFNPFTGRLDVTNDASGVAGGDLSGTYPNPIVDGLQGNPVSSATPLNGQTLQFNGTSWVPGATPNGGSGGGGISYYFNFGTSGASPTTNLPATPNSPKQLGRTGVVNQSSYTSGSLSQVNYDLIAGFVTEVNDPSITEIPAGLWDFNIWAASNANAANQTIIRLFVYKYNGVNAPTLLAQSDDISIYDPTVIAQYIASVVFPQTAILATDRIYIELRAKGTTNNRTISIYFGDATPSHVHTTIPSVAGSGVVKVVNGVFQSPASLITNSDVSNTAAISASKISGLSTVATSGSYADLSGKPSIPAPQVNSDWNATTGVAAILNKPTIQTFDQDLNTFDGVTFAQVAADVNSGTLAWGNNTAQVSTGNSDGTLTLYNFPTGIPPSTTVVGTLSSFNGQLNFQRTSITRSRVMLSGNSTTSDLTDANTLAYLASANSFTAGQTITAAANTSALTASYSVTGANTTPLLDLSGTWNTTGAARGILLNITRTAAADTSSLLSLNVGGANRFSVIDTVSASPTIMVGGSGTQWNIRTRVASGVGCNFDGVVGLGGTLQFLSSASSNGGGDTILARDAANALAQRNGANAQTFRLYNTFTDASNFERGFMRWNSNVLEIGTEAGGTGSARALNIVTAGTTTALQIANGGGASQYITGLRGFTTTGGMTVGAVTGVTGSTGSSIVGLTAINYASGASDPTTTTLTSGNWQVYRNTTSGTIRLWANNNGTMVSVALA